MFRSIPIRRFNTTTASRALTNTPFPWRSSPIALDRVVSGDDLSGQAQVFNERWIRAAVAGRLLGVPWIHIFLNTWKQELADDLRWAFQKGLAGVLSNTFSIPIEKIDFEEHGIEIDTSTRIPDKEWAQSDSTNARNYCMATLEDSLSAMYSSFDTDKFDVKLRLQPLSHQFVFAYSLPLTRASVAKDPSLKDTYRALQDEKTNHSQVLEMEKDLDANSSASTIFVDVSIEFLERFQVRDKATGELVQGSDHDQSVLHLVRFEMESGDKASWNIVDWDDLLQGNIWH